MGVNGMACPGARHQAPTQPIVLTTLTTVKLKELLLQALHLPRRGSPGSRVHANFAPLVPMELRNRPCLSALRQSEGETARTKFAALNPS
jgi:hypothetical protein